MKRAEFPPKRAGSGNGEKKSRKARGGPVSGAPGVVRLSRKSPKPGDDKGLVTPCMRSDIDFRVDGPEYDPKSDELPGALTVHDPKSGRVHNFDPQEHLLCRLADGTSSVTELAAALADKSGNPLSPDQVARFFRRVKFLGLLESDPEKAVAEREGSQGDRQDDTTENVASDPAPTRFGDGSRMARRAAALSGEGAEDAGPGRFGAMRAGIAGRNSDEAPALTASFEAARRAREAERLEAPVRPSDSQKGDAQTPSSAMQPPSGRNAVQSSGSTPDDTTQTDKSEAAGSGPGRFGRARLVSDNKSFDIAPGRKAGVEDTPPAGLGTQPGRHSAESDQARTDRSEQAATNPAPGQNRRGAPGMMGGGMMPGAMMGGGMMGGGMMPGQPGGMMAGGMMGGAGAGMMGGGMMRGRPQAPQSAPQSAGPAQLPLMNPGWLLRALYVLGWPLKFFIWAIVPLVAVAGLSMLNNLPALVDDVTAMMGSYSVVTKVLIALLVVNLSSRLAQGVAIVAHGGAVPKLGINLILGLIPRFYIDVSAIDGLDRKGQLWAYGAPLLARLFAFSAGILVWAVTREQGGTLPLVALIVAKFGLMMFAFTSWPLFPADGMRWFGALLNEPKLMPKAVMAFRHKVLGRDLPPMMDRSELPKLTVFAVGVLLSTLVLIGMSAALAFVMLEGSLGGLGVMLFLGMLAVATLWFLALIRTQKARIPGAGQMNMAMAGAAPARAKSKAAVPEDEDVPLPNKARVVWALILCAGLLVAFMPYDYEAGGEVEILPLARGQAVARTDGEIVEVLVREGASVERGQDLARLSDWDQLAEISIAEARLDGALAKLRKLEAGAQEEEVELARAQVGRAEANVTFRLAEVERARELLANETVSRATLERAETEYATALADYEYAEANLALVESGSTSEEIEIARADVARLERELAYARDELSRTTIVAPIDGYVVTSDLQLKRGDYMREGDLLLEIEQSDTVTATIAIPEADAGLVSEGQTVRLRVRGDSESEIVGEVRSVAPAAEELGYGRVVRAMAEFQNTDGKLRSAMTGHAKVESAEMRVWEAYFRSIKRFVQIDMWSWIP